MKRIIIIFLISYNSGFSQDKIANFTTNSGELIFAYKTTNNEKVFKYNTWIKGSLNITAQFLYYYDEKNQLKRTPQSDIQMLVVGNKKYMNLPISSFGMKRLHQVVAENDLYLLTNYFSNGKFYLYITRKSDFKQFEKKVEHSIKKTKDLKLFDKYVEFYFPQCIPLDEKINRNIENLNYKNRYHSILNSEKNIFTDIDAMYCR